MSDKPLSERLQVKSNRALAVVGAEPGQDAAIGVQKQRADIAKADVVLLFARNQKILDAKLPKLLARIAPGAILWIAYPKLTSPLADDLSRDVLREQAPGFGLDTVAQIAMDDDWSALRFKRV